MTSSRAQQAFLRYRTHGTPEALAQVFDELAPELLLVASHVTRDPAEAEDLVQTTFLQAMRDAQRFDGARPVGAWLSGILRHRAIDARRRAGAVRTLTASGGADEGSAADMLAARQPSPDELVASRDELDAIATAIHELGEPYRDVLVLHLLHGLEPIAIAHALGRAPGTVRQQLRRGLDRLRNTLPHVASAGLVPVLQNGPGLAAVREAVLGQAAAPIGVAGASVVATSTSASALVGVLTMKSLTVVLACLLIATLAWFALRGTPSEEAVALGPSLPDVVQAAVPETGPAEEGPVAGSPVPVRDGLPSDERRATLTTEEFEPSLTVRVVFADGSRPAADVGVYVRAETALDPGAESAQTAGADLGYERRTDASGRVRFPELTRRPGAGHVLVQLDRADVARVVDLEHEADVELVVPLGVRVAGRVVDLNEAPVAGAWVLRANERHHDRLQGLTRTDAAGRFVLEHVTPGSELLARAARFQPSELETVRARGALGAEESVEIELVMGARGHVLRGSVRAPDGTPAAYAWIAIGVDEDARDQFEGATREPDDGERVKPLDREGFFLRADAQGRFETDEVPAGHAIVLAREVGGRDGVAWTSLWIRPRVDHDVDLRLERGAEIVGDVRDAAGRPLAGRAIEAEWEGNHALGQFEDDLGPFFSDRRVTTDVDGSFRLDGLLPGDYDLAVLGADRKLVRAERVVEAGSTLHWDPVVEAAGSLAVRLVGPDGGPLAGWALVTEQRNRGLSRALVERRTDADGRLLVPDLAPGSQTLLVHPPRETYPSVAVARREVRPGPEEVTLRLTQAELPSASLAGAWHDESGPVARARVRLVREAWGVDVTSFTDDEGRFVFDDLAPGPYVLLADHSGFPRATPLTDVELQTGEDHDLGTLVLETPVLLALALRAEDEGELDGLRLTLEPRSQEASARPRFERGDGAHLYEAAVWPGSYRLRVEGDDVAPELIDLELGDEQRSELELTLSRGVPVVFDLTLPEDPEMIARDAFSYRVQVWDDEQRLVLSRRVRERLATASTCTLHLKPGEYRARFEGYLRSGESSAADVEFQAGGRGAPRTSVSLR